MKTKTYQVWSVNGCLYAVDSVVSDTWMIHPIHGLRDMRHEVKFTPSDHLTKNWQAVVASMNTSLGLPILPEVEDNMAEAYTTNGVGLMNDRMRLLFYKGYKANPRKYTEADVARLIKFLRDREDVYQLVDDGHIDKWVKSYTQYYLNLPKAVELEVIPTDGLPSHISNDVDNWLKVDVNNFVNVVKWIYD